jgi:hypothetical protein
VKGLDQHSQGRAIYQEQQEIYRHVTQDTRPVRDPRTESEAAIQKVTQGAGDHECCAVGHQVIYARQFVQARQHSDADYEASESDCREACQLAGVIEYVMQA